MWPVASVAYFRPNVVAAAANPVDRIVRVASGGRVNRVSVHKLLARRPRHAEVRDAERRRQLTRWRWPI